MKREGDHRAFEHATKAPHHEKSQKNTVEADLKYSKYGMDNPKEMDESEEKLASYVKKHRMKY